MMSIFTEKLVNTYRALKIEDDIPDYDSARYHETWSPNVEETVVCLDSFQFDQLKTSIKSLNDAQAACASAAMLAAIYLKNRKLGEARTLCEIALGFYPMDLFPQRLILEVEEQQSHSVGELSQYLRSSFCGRPFSHFETATTGDVYVCCPSWLPRPIGNINTDSWEQIWQSDAALEIRESIMDGTFKYCSPIFCNPITGRRLESRASISAEQLTKYQRQNPTSAVFSHDLSCNLSCPSCRKETIAVGKSEQGKLNELSKNTLMPIIESCDNVGITGSGDPFGSVHFRKLITDYCAIHDGPRKIDLYTNGVLLDERTWQSLRLRENIRCITISIDAACEETYDIVRRGGNFDRLMKNLEFLGNERVSSGFDKLILAFTVQKLNYKEMPAFVRLGKRFHADAVAFWQIRNWGTYSIDEFLDHAVANASHPEHEAFVRVCQDPLLGESICFLNDLSGFRKAHDLSREIEA